MTLPLDDIAAGRLCHFGRPDAPRRAVLWGDSHALALLPAFESLGGARGFDVFLRRAVELPATSPGRLHAIQ
jgi:hypothetical protein